jgi:hypothetical protein
MPVIEGTPPNARGYHSATAIPIKKGSVNKSNDNVVARVVFFGGFRADNSVHVLEKIKQAQLPRGAGFILWFLELLLRPAMDTLQHFWKMKRLYAFMEDIVVVSLLVIASFWTQRHGLGSKALLLSLQGTPWMLPKVWMVVVSATITRQC